MPFFYNIKIIFADKQLPPMLKFCLAMSKKVSEWKERKEAVLRGEIPPPTESTSEDNIYDVEDNEVGWGLLSEGIFLIVEVKKKLFAWHDRDMLLVCG